MQKTPCSTNTKQILCLPKSCQNVFEQFYNYTAPIHHFYISDCITIYLYIYRGIISYRKEVTRLYAYYFDIRFNFMTLAI